MSLGFSFFSLSHSHSSFWVGNMVIELSEFHVIFNLKSGFLRFFIMFSIMFFGLWGSLSFDLSSSGHSLFHGFELFLSHGISVVVNDFIIFIAQLHERNGVFS